MVSKNDLVLFIVEINSTVLHSRKAEMKGSKIIVKSTHCV